jgi:hypothetical protein
MSQGTVNNIKMDFKRKEQEIVELLMYIDIFRYLQFGWHPVAAAHYTFTHKQYKQKHDETEYITEQ